MMAEKVVGEPQPVQLVDNNCKSYTIHFKRRVLLRLEEAGNISAVSREFGVARQNIQRWNKKIRHVHGSCYKSLAKSTKNRVGFGCLEFNCN